MKELKAYIANQTSIVVHRESFASKIKHSDALIASLYGDGCVGHSTHHDHHSIIRSRTVMTRTKDKEPEKSILSTMSGSVLCQLLPYFDTEYCWFWYVNHQFCHCPVHGIICRVGLSLVWDQQFVVLKDLWILFLDLIWMMSFSHRKQQKWNRDA